MNNIECIPEWLVSVKETIFKGLSKEEAMLWPERFLSAIKPGIDLEKIKAPFMIFILESVLEKFDHEKYPESEKIIIAVIKLYKSKKKKKPWGEARQIAGVVYASVYDTPVAAAVIYAAAAVYAATAPDYDIHAIAQVVHAAAHAAIYNDRKEEYKKFANKLIELIEGLR